VWNLSKLLWRPDEEAINSRQSLGDVLLSPSWATHRNLTSY
jgi:hypothetical protein